MSPWPAWHNIDVKYTWKNFSSNILTKIIHEVTRLQLLPNSYSNRQLWIMTKSDLNNIHNVILIIYNTHSINTVSKERMHERDSEYHAQHSRQVDTAQIQTRTYVTIFHSLHNNNVIHRILIICSELFTTFNRFSNAKKSSKKVDATPKTS